MATW